MEASIIFSHKGTGIANKNSFTAFKPFSPFEKFLFACLHGYFLLTVKSFSF
jgi:hypothetical protein